MPKTCYICGEEAKSKEHAPARCYFPEKDDYRKNLITVPSCKVHNEDTSKDDKYVRNVIAMSIGTNAVAYKQFLEKTLKSFKKSIGLLKSTTGKRMNISVEGKPSYAFEIDRIRFDKMMKKIGYALFYHEFKQSWKRELIVAARNLYTDKLKQDELGSLMNDFEKSFPHDTFDGNNPQVFKYKFGDTNSENANDKILRMIFYEGFHVWLIPITGTETPNVE